MIRSAVCMLKNVDGKNRKSTVDGMASVSLKGKMNSYKH